MSQIIENYVLTVLANLLELLIKHKSVGKSPSLGISFLWSLCHINCLLHQYLTIMPQSRLKTHSLLCTQYSALKTQFPPA